MYQALYRKWRPRLFDDVVGQNHITETLKRQVSSNRTSHAYLFTGTRGTGKTTCAKILAKAVNCQNPVEGNPCGHCAACVGIDDGSILDVVELDAASNNGVDQVRALRDEAVYAPAAVKKRVYIVDEVHMLSTAAFNALLKIMEEPPEHLMFILATTELHKVPATILSRCQRFTFKRIQGADIAGRLNYVAEREGIDLTAEAAALLARLADGGMRDALSLLDQCAISGGQVSKDAVLDTLGLAGNLQTAHIMNHIKRGNTAAALTSLSDLYANGKDVSAVLDELAGLTRDLLVRKTAPEGESLLAGGYDEGTLSALERGFSAARLIYSLTLLQDTLSNLKNSANRRTDAELCIMKLCDQKLEDSPLALSARIARLEQALASGAFETVTVTAVPAPELPPEGMGEERMTAASAPAPELGETAGIPASAPEPVVPERIAPAPIPVATPAAPVPHTAAPVNDGGNRTTRTRRAPQPQSTATVCPVSPDRFWIKLVERTPGLGPLKPLLSDPSRCMGVLKGGQLTIFMIDESWHTAVTSSFAMDRLREAAAELAGKPIVVTVVKGRGGTAGSEPTASSEVKRAPASSQQAVDPMEEVLSGMGGSIIKQVE